ncbi:nucleotide pyrophosphohydrolase [Candidatus Kuenenbacteria bacterium]|nr:nucleotide pyrophosphohydrolase [Candidatus Kuenenbacteria bacterium]
MELKNLSKRAVEIKKRYSKIELDKFGKEWTNTQIMQGFVGDVGDLMKLIMVKEGIREIEDVDNKIAHELADCLFSILVLAQRFNIDIEQAFIKTMNELDERLKKYKRGLSPKNDD